MRVLIQAHPARAELAEGLLDCLDGAAEIVYDPEPDSPRRSPWRTYRACLERAAGEDVFVVQEDVVVCGRLLEGVKMAREARPGSPLAFFVPAKPPVYTNAIYRARDAGSAWAELPLGSWIPVVATLWPADVAARLLEWYASAQVPRQWSADDEIAGRFLAQTRIPLYASVPSLVEHPDTVASVMNGYRRVGNGLDPGRRAYFFIGDDPERYGCDATRVDWTA